MKPAIITAVLGLVTVVLIVGVIQPLARMSLSGTSVASVMDGLRTVWSYLHSGHLYKFVKGVMFNLLLYGSLFLIFPVVWLWSRPGSLPRRDLYQCLGLIFLAPLSHWASMVVNVGVHFMPVVAFTMIAISLAVSRLALAIPRKWTWQSGVALALVGFYFVGNALAFGYRQGHYLGKEYAVEKRANAHCLRMIDSLVPPGKSLCYWTARGLDGFLGNRSNLWRFPHFFDQTDFLVMQKNAQNTFFQTKIRPGQDIYQALEHGTYHSSGEEASTDNAVIEAICHRLVKVNGTHTICFDDPDMVILKRKKFIRLEQSPETRGFGFLNNFPKFWQAKFGSSG